MNVITLKNIFIEKLLLATKNHFIKSSIDLNNKKICAFMFYCSNGCRQFGIAIAEEGELNEKIYASEWNYINKHYNEFDNINLYIDELYEIFYEEDIEGVNLDDMNDDELWHFISNFFIDCIFSTITTLKKENFFNQSIFVNNPLLGLQFTVPDELAEKMIIELSYKINSDYWHKKILNSYL